MRRVQFTPQIFSLRENGERRERGYVILDLRSARQDLEVSSVPSQTWLTAPQDVFENSKWYPILNSEAPKLRPELRVLCLIVHVLRSHGGDTLQRASIATRPWCCGWGSPREAHHSEAPSIPATSGRHLAASI